MSEAIAFIAGLFAMMVVCLIAYLSLWNAIDDIKNSLGYIKSTCNNDYQIKQTEHILRERIGAYHKDLLTEIACLATKNNEDIKRSKEGFQVGDVIEYGGEEALVLDRLNAGEEVTDYTVWSITLGVQQVSASHLEHNAKFLRRASLKDKKQ